MAGLVAHEPGGKLDNMAVEGRPILLDEDQSAIARQRNDGNDAFGVGPLDEEPAVALEHAQVGRFEDDGCSHGGTRLAAELFVDPIA